MKDRHIAELYKIYIKCPREVINKLVAASISRREATATGLLLAATLVFLLTDENITGGEPSHGHCICYFSVGIKHNNPKPLTEKKKKSVFGFTVPEGLRSIMSWRKHGIKWQARWQEQEAENLTFCHQEEAERPRWQ